MKYLIFIILLNLTFPLGTIPKSYMENYVSKDSLKKIKDKLSEIEGNYDDLLIDYNTMSITISGLEDSLIKDFSSLVTSDLEKIKAEILDKIDGTISKNSKAINKDLRSQLRLINKLEDTINDLSNSKSSDVSIEDINLIKENFDLDLDLMKEDFDTYLRSYKSFKKTMNFELKRLKEKISKLEE